MDFALDAKMEDGAGKDQKDHQMEPHPRITRPTCEVKVEVAKSLPVPGLVVAGLAKRDEGL